MELTLQKIPEGNWDSERYSYELLSDDSTVDAPEWMEDANGWCMPGKIKSIPYRERKGPWWVSITSNTDELKNWLKSYIEANPVEALNLLAEVLPLVAENLRVNEKACESK